MTKNLAKASYVKYIIIGLLIGLGFSLAFRTNILNGISIGLSLGILLQKIIQENKLFLAIYILIGLLLGCVSANLLSSSLNISICLLSLGMLMGTVVYMLFPINIKIKKIGNDLIKSLIIGIILGGLTGYFIYKITGLYYGIGIGMIFSLVYEIKK